MANWAQFDSHNNVSLLMLNTDSDLSSRLQVPAFCQHQEVLFLAYTGASVSIADISFYNRFYAHLPLLPYNEQLRGASGTSLTVLDSTLSIKINGKGYNLELITLDNDLNNPMLGRNWLSILSPHWKENLFPENKLLSSNYVFQYNSNELVMI